MSAYLLLQTLHTLSSTALCGLGAGSAYYALRAWRTGNVEVIAATFKHLVFADWAFTATTAVLQPLSGIGLMHLAGWSLQQSWLQWTFGLYVLAGICWLPVVWIQMRVKRRLAETGGPDIPGDVHRLMRIWFALGWPAFAALIAIVWLMITKPG